MYALHSLLHPLPSCLPYPACGDEMVQQVVAVACSPITVLGQRLCPHRQQPVVCSKGRQRLAEAGVKVRRVPAQVAKQVAHLGDHFVAHMHTHGLATTPPSRLAALQRHTLARTLALGWYSSARSSNTSSAAPMAR